MAPLLLFFFSLLFFLSFSLSEKEKSPRIREARRNGSGIRNNPRLIFSCSLPWAEVLQERTQARFPDNPRRRVKKKETASPESGLLPFRKNPCQLHRIDLHPDFRSPVPVLGKQIFPDFRFLTDSGHSGFFKSLLRSRIPRSHIFRNVSLRDNPGTASGSSHQHHAEVPFIRPQIRQRSGLEKDSRPLFLPARSSSRRGSRQRRRLTGRWKAAASCPLPFFSSLFSPLRLLLFFCRRTLKLRLRRHQRRRSGRRNGEVDAGGKNDAGIRSGLNAGSGFSARFPFFQRFPGIQSGRILDPGYPGIFFFLLLHDFDLLFFPDFPGKLFFRRAFFPLFPKHVSLPSRTGREEESEGKETAGEGEFQKQALEKEKNEDSRPFF